MGGSAHGGRKEVNDGLPKPWQCHHKAQGAAVLPLIAAPVAARPTYGYRRNTAILNRRLRAQRLVLVNRKRIYQSMRTNNPSRVRKYTLRPDLAHDGKVVVMRSNL